MVQFNDWCDAADSKVGAHGLRILSGDPVRLNAGVVATAAVLPTHYAAAERVAGILRRLSKTEAAKFVECKLPTSKSIRPGDLGEILATEWIATQGGYQVPIKRLRWKDHRNMAMRGDDVIGNIRISCWRWLAPAAVENCNRGRDLCGPARALWSITAFPNVSTASGVSSRVGSNRVV